MSQAIYPGRARFGNLFAETARAAHLWAFIACGELVVILVLVGAYVMLASSSRVVPYVVEVDELGRARAFGPAEELRKPDERVLRALLALWVRNARTVSSDPAAQRTMLYDAFAYVAEAGQSYLETYLGSPGADPRTLALRMTREVHVVSVLRVPGSETWRVQWTETARSTGSGSAERSAWEALLTTRLIPPTSAEGLLANPLGFYVTSISWSPTTPTPGAEP